MATVLDQERAGARATTAPWAAAFDRAARRAMRRDAERLPGAVAGASCRAHAAALLAWCDEALGAINARHRHESSELWPALTDVRPELAGPIRALADDHDAIDRLAADLHRALRALGDVTAAATLDPCPHAEATAAANAWSSALLAHLDREAEVLGSAVRDLDPAVRDALERRSLHRLPLASLAFTLQWICEGLAPAEVDELLDGAPVVARMLRRDAFAARYASLVAALRTPN